MTSRTSRRAFLERAAYGGVGLVVLGRSGSARGAPANERLDVGLIGVGGRGTWFVDTIPKMENVVALCDVNAQKVDGAFKRWTDLSKKFATSEHSWEQHAAKEYTRPLGAKPKAFADFRVMLDKMGEGLDAVVIAIPDHTHAVAAAAAIRAGKHVFLEKPLTRTVHESRALRELARKAKVATSMGNQGTASGQFRRALELLREGLIGEVKQVHVWNTGGGSDKKAPPKGAEPVPEDFDWDLWLGPAKMRPYHREWTRRNAWRDFGTCQLGNWASHTANLAFMAYKVHSLWLADPPPAEPRPVIRVRAESSGINRLSFPKWERIVYEVPEREGLPPITIIWYNGGVPGTRPLLEDLLVDGKRFELPFAGALFVGTKGRLFSTGHNATFRLMPGKDFKDIETERPQKVDASRGHERDWLIACRGGKPAWADFDYADALNEFLMLGNVATQFDATLEFEPIACKVVNHKEADAALRSEYRRGWVL